MAASRPPYAELQGALSDTRGGRVTFVSHCLLNQNTRYLGGAVCPGAVPCAIQPLLDDGVGIVQMPCPEQRAWGGVLKPPLLWVLRHRWIARAGPALAGVVGRYTSYRYRRLARRVVDEVDDYVTSGLTVTAIVGVGGSPSCGVDTTLDLAAALAAIARSPDAPVTPAWLTGAVVQASQRPGEGLFVHELSRELARRGLVVPVVEHTLVAPDR